MKISYSEKEVECIIEDFTQNIFNLACDGKDVSVILKAYGGAEVDISPKEAPLKEVE